MSENDQYITREDVIKDINKLIQLKQNNIDEIEQSISKIESNSIKSDLTFKKLSLEIETKVLNDTIKALTNFIC